MEQQTLIDLETAVSKAITARQVGTHELIEPGTIGQPCCILGHALDHIGQLTTELSVAEAFKIPKPNIVKFNAEVCSVARLNDRGYKRRALNKLIKAIKNYS